MREIKVSEFAMILLRSFVPSACSSFNVGKKSEINLLVVRAPNRNLLLSHFHMNGGVPCHG